VSQEWYYSADGDRQGPITAAELKKLAEAGTLKATDLVWKDGMADWTQAKTIKGLFGGRASSAGTPASKSSEQAAAKPRSAAADDDDRLARSRRRDDGDEDDRPRRHRDEDDEDDRPARSRRRDQEDEDRPARRRDEDDEHVDEQDDDRPRKKRRRVPEDTANTKMVAGLLGILIGWTGAHRFYLGDTTGGIIRLCLNLVCAGGIIGLIEGIIYLTKSDEDFYQDYIVDKKAWF
jgi:TM2 domain-containing membrane protein YozV